MKTHKEELACLLDLFTGSGYIAPYRYPVSEETEKLFKEAKKKKLIRHVGGTKFIISEKGEKYLKRHPVYYELAKRLHS